MKYIIHYYCFLCLITLSASATETLFEDYEAGGAFYFSHRSSGSPHTNSLHQTNDAHDAGIYGKVKWATKWCGAASFSSNTQDVDWADTYELDIKVPEGEPVESGTLFYFQMNCAPSVPGGWAYWSTNIMQTNVLADGYWYRVQIPFGSFNASGGGGSTAPVNYSNVIGVTAGMQHDASGTDYQFKTAYFDNIKATDAGVSSVTVTQLQPGTTKTLLEDYTSGGLFNFHHANNNFTNVLHQTNDAYDAGYYSTVEWATLYISAASTGSETNLNGNNSIHFDVMTPEGQPEEAGSSFYIQVTCTPHPTGWAYHEYYLSQSLTPADSHWYRVEFPLSYMSHVGGGGADDPTDYSEVIGVAIGMTYDSTGTNYSFKTAHFDNLAISDLSVTGMVVTAISRGAIFKFR